MGGVVVRDGAILAGLKRVIHQTGQPNLSFIRRDALSVRAHVDGFRENIIEIPLQSVSDFVANAELTSVVVAAADGLPRKQGRKLREVVLEALRLLPIDVWASRKAVQVKLLQSSGLVVQIAGRHVIDGLRGVQRGKVLRIGRTGAAQEALQSGNRCAVGTRENILPVRILLDLAEIHSIATISFGKF